MSYTQLTARLVDSQRSMLGESAVDIARSTDGVTVDEDGTVTDVGANGRAVTEELSRRYIQMLGDAARQQLQDVAAEFDDLRLPPALGGPVDTEPASPGPATKPPATVEGPTAASGGTVSDGGTVTVHSPTGGQIEGPATTDAGGSGEPDAVSEPVTVGYTVASSIDGDYASADLDSVYLMPVGAEGFQVPVAVTDAIVEALTAATDLGDDDAAAFVGGLDTERLVATLDDENGEQLSYHDDGITLTVHRSGSLAVH